MGVEFCLKDNMCISRKWVKREERGMEREKERTSYFTRVRDREKGHDSWYISSHSNLKIKGYSSNCWGLKSKEMNLSLQPLEKVLF